MNKTNFNPLDFPVIFQPPQYHVSSHWMVHVPFAMFLVDSIRPNLIVELGVDTGVSFFSFCQAVKVCGLSTNVYGVYSNNANNAGSRIRQVPFQDIVHYNESFYKAFSTISQIDIENAQPSIDPEAVDFLHLNSELSDHDLKHIQETWIPRLKDGSIILISGINKKERQIKNTHLWERLRLQYQSFDLLEGEGLGLILIGKSDSSRIDGFFHQDSASIKDFFYYLGKNIERINQIDQMEKDQRGLKAKLAENETKLFLIQNTKTWKLIQIFWIIRSKFIPYGSDREKRIRTWIQALRRIKNKLFARPKRKPAIFPGVFSHLLDINTITPTTTIIGKIGIHLHVFYPDLIPEFVNYLKRMPFAYDLFISVPDEKIRENCEKYFRDLTNQKRLTIEIVPNRGRDIAPFLYTFGKELKTYDFIAHLHTKKSLYNNGSTMGWREYLCNTLFKNEQQIKKILTLLSDVNPYGLIYPQNFNLLPYFANTWLANHALGREWCRRLGIAEFPRGYFNFPASSMFWARGDALKPLFESGITIDEFPTESGQTDGTLAHCLERIIALLVANNGFKYAMIMDEDNPSWSPWRLDQYLARTLRGTEYHITNINIKVVAFDVFDTLLTRPLLNPEIIKNIVSSRLDERLAKIYLDHRAKAENSARVKIGHDVSLTEIVNEMSSESDLTQAEANLLLQQEQDVEENIVYLRQDILNLLLIARELGKRIIITSDMFLPKALITKMLLNNGIPYWDEMYLSNDTGRRKDTGELFEYILDKENIDSKQLMMVGDNERSDLQIPLDIGAGYLHVLKPVELARGIPRLFPLVEKYESTDQVDHQLTLGTIIQKNFSPVFFSDLDPASLFPPGPFQWGYSIIGPLVVGFSDWLTEISSQHKLNKLYFLSREGKILKLAYDKWRAAFNQGPQSEYLRLSRRAVTVAGITDLEDIISIAKTTFFANSITFFLKERYGLEFSPEKWEKLSHATGLNPKSTVEVRNGQVPGEILKFVEMIQEDILSKAEIERPGLTAYLADCGLENNTQNAVVDVGYSATIQGRLNQMLHRPVHGLYMMTDDRVNKIREKYGVLIQGCFADGVSRSNPPRMYAQSFTLEKFLSSDEGQVIRYTIQEGGLPQPEIRPMTIDEENSNPFREEIKKGMVEYIDDMIKIKKSIYPDYRPPLELGKEIFNAFVSSLSPGESQLLQSIILDDYYCGRGLVR